jgi:hypothetical protein
MEVRELFWFVLQKTPGLPGDEYVKRNKGCGLARGDLFFFVKAGPWLLDKQGGEE